MVPAACMLLWTLLFSVGSRAAAGAQDQTSTTTPTRTRTRTPAPSPTQIHRASLRFGGPARSRSTGRPRRSTLPRKMRMTVEEDENDALATDDRLAGPAAAELLATVTGISRSSDPNSNEDEDGSLEEGVVIDARKSTAISTTLSTTTVEHASTGRMIANSQEREIRLTTSPPPANSKSTDDDLLTSPESSLSQWSTAGSTPRPWPSPSRTAMPPPEDLRVVLMPWGPWHCHCKSGTMSRSRAGKLQGLSGRLRVGALSQLRVEHRPCTYHQCPCNRHREECPLDSALCPENSCSSQTTSPTTTTTPIPPIHVRRRPLLPPPSPSPALAFWKKVRSSLEDIWNSLNSVFTEMQPTERTKR